MEISAAKECEFREEFTVFNSGNLGNFGDFGNSSSWLVPRLP